MFVQHAENKDILKYVTHLKFRQSWARKKIFETRYLYQMGGDYPRIKNVFLRVSRGVISTSQIGGTAPLSGQTPKVPRPQKNLNAIYLSYVNFPFANF